jgi:hypothetical protein
VVEGSSLALAISALALVVSVTTLWLTYFRRGSVRMTRPTQVYFGPDGSREEGLNGQPKIFLRALLIADSKRGRVVETLYATLTRGEMKQNFNIWVHGEDRLVRGSGLHVGDAGLVTNHHFLLPPDSSEFRWRGGAYQLEIFAALLGDRKPTKLTTLTLEMSNAEASSISTMMCGIYYDWGPQAGGYVSHLHAPRMPVADAAQAPLPDDPN